MPSKAICPPILHDFTVRCCATYWQEISNVRSLCLRDLPHTYFVPTLFSTKKQKQKTQKHARAPPAWTRGNLNLLLLLLFFIYFIIILLFFICSPNSSKAKIKFYSVYLALVRFHQKLLPLFMIVTKSLLTKIQHHIKIWLKMAILT